MGSADDKKRLPAKDVGAAGDVLSPPDSPSIEYSASKSALFRLLLVNTIANVLTAGIYRFWAKTRLRRFFWSGFLIDGDPVEYVGRGLELFIGFIFAVVVLTVAAVVVVTIPEAIWPSPFTGVLGQTVFAVVIYILIPIAIYRARRYRMTRTVWRGVRFGQIGSAAGFAARFYGYWFLTVTSLGLVYPWMRVGLTRYYMNNTKFGGTLFNFAGKGSRLFLNWLPVLAAVAVGLAVYGIAIEDVFNSPSFDESTSETLESPEASELSGFVTEQIGFLIGLAIPAFALAAIMSLWYRVYEFRYFASVVSLNGIKARSRLSFIRTAVNLIPPSIAMIIYWASLLWLFVTVFELAFAAGGADQTDGEIDPFDFVDLVAPFSALMLSSFVYQVLFNFFRVDLFRSVARSFEFSGFGEIAKIAQDKSPPPRFGEGLFDAFDLGGL
jgi:uncharacterized membrane protein YjgN (DUF898 family)